MEPGIQLHLPTFRDYSLPDLVEIAKAAASAGFRQIWVTDNLESRHIFVVLAALASNVEVKLGTAILGQYFHTPVVTAAALVSVSELMDGRELSVGIGHGNPQTDRFIKMPRPLAFMRETVECVNRLVLGESIRIGDYPLLADYFNFVDDASFQVAKGSTGPIRFYQGGNGPKGLAMAGELMSGVIIGPEFRPAASVGRLDTMLEIVSAAAKRAGRADGFAKIGEVKVSIARDHRSARQHLIERGPFSLPGHLRWRGYDDNEMERLGISHELAHKIDLVRDGQEVEDVNGQALDALIDSVYIAGDPSSCRERLCEIVTVARHNGFTQLLFSELGPNPIEAVELLADIVPSCLAEAPRSAAFLATGHEESERP